VTESHLDQNKHVNNTIYSQWVLGALKHAYHRSELIQEYEINFSKETFLGDQVEVFNHPAVQSSGLQNQLLFKANRTEDSAIVFTARILGNFKPTLI